MKKNYFIALIVLTCGNVDAQYKKASFLNKTGRTYDVGGAGHFISEGSATIPGIIYSYGKETAGKRLFHWFDLELLLPAKFSYSTNDVNTRTPVTISGKSTLGLIYRYNLACYLMDNSNAVKKMLPFVSGGLNITITGGDVNSGSVTYMPFISSDVQKQPSISSGNIGANLGLGGVYNISSKIGFKLTAGYSYQYNITSGMEDYKSQGYSVYNAYTSHPYATLGIRFTMDRDDD